MKSGTSKLKSKLLSRLLKILLESKRILPLANQTDFAALAAIAGENAKEIE